MSTSPQIDAINCVQFVQNYFDIKCIGQKNLMPGITYNFTIQLDQPASNLTVTPTVSYRYVTVQPAVVRFDSYQGTSQTFQLVVKSDAKAGSYQIKFKLVQDPTMPQ